MYRIAMLAKMDSQLAQGADYEPNPLFGASKGTGFRVEFGQQVTRKKTASEKRPELPDLPADLVSRGDTPLPAIPPDTDGGEGL